MNLVTLLPVLEDVWLVLGAFPKLMPFTAAWLSLDLRESVIPGKLDSLRPLASDFEFAAASCLHRAPPLFFVFFTCQLLSKLQIEQCYRVRRLRIQRKYVAASQRLPRIELIQPLKTGGSDQGFRATRGEYVPAGPNRSFLALISRFRPGTVAQNDQAA
jgi:hypothetical protein